MGPSWQPHPDYRLRPAGPNAKPLLNRLLSCLSCVAVQWEVANLSAHQGKVLSEPFEIGGYSW